MGVSSSTTNSRQLLYGMPDHKAIVDVREIPASPSSVVLAHPYSAYPAQRGKTPGVITVSTEMFYFTPLLSGPKLEIPMGDIVGIKRAMPKGISIRVQDVSQENGERNEKFMLVYERDELFGRLVGMGGKKWMKV